jgi:hypothetical protein
MNQHAPDDWQALAGIWKADDARITVAEIEDLHARQHRRLQIARMAELACSVLGVVAALWLALVSRFLWVGILTVAFSIGSVHVVLRTRRMPVPQGAADLGQSLRDSLEYLEWLAAQLRYGRALGFVALFAVVFAASTQLMRLTTMTPSGLIATAAAGVAISVTLSWNMTLAWQVWRRAARLRTFTSKLAAERDNPSPQDFS